MKLAVIIVAAVFLFGVLEAKCRYCQKSEDESYEYRVIRKMRSPTKQAIKDLEAAAEELKPIAKLYDDVKSVKEPLDEVSESIGKARDLMKKVKHRGSKALRHMRLYDAGLEKMVMSIRRYRKRLYLYALPTNHSRSAEMLRSSYFLVAIVD